MTSETSSEKRACVDCNHISDVWGVSHHCNRPLTLEFDMVKGWSQPSVNLPCKTVREGVYERTRTPVPQAKLCGEHAIHFQPKPVLPPEAVTKGIEDIPVNTGITFNRVNKGAKDKEDNFCFWSVILVSIGFSLWCLLK